MADDRERLLKLFSCYKSMNCNPFMCSYNKLITTVVHVPKTRQCLYIAIELNNSSPTLELAESVLEPTHCFSCNITYLKVGVKVVYCNKFKKLSLMKSAIRYNQDLNDPTGLQFMFKVNYSAYGLAISYNSYSRLTKFPLIHNFIAPI